MISSTCWIPRGFAAEYPEKYEIDEEEMERINAMANLEISDAKAGIEESESNENDSEKKLKGDLELDDDLKEYDLEHYDDNENEDEASGQKVSIFPGLSNTDAKFHEEDGEDPYLSLPNEEDLKEEREELQIYPTDNLVLATRTEDDISYLDVFVYDDGAGAVDESDEDYKDDLEQGFVREPSLYVHHDIMLPAFPLCVEWINYRPGQTVVDQGSLNIGNFAAIGTFDPQIEIWNLDCVDKAFPDLILGQNSLDLKQKKKKKKKTKGHNTTSHTDAILSLSHNRIHRNVLASSSADCTVKLWDLNNGIAVKSLNSIHNNNTISSTQWHTLEGSILLSGGYDGSCGVSDVRISDESAMTKRYNVASGEEVENVSWGHDSTPELFYAGTDNGNVFCFDVRQESKPLWTLHAHDAGISSLQLNHHIPGMLATSAMGEKTVKLWKCPVDSSKGPSMVLSRDFGIGNILATSFPGDIEVAGHLSVGGTAGTLKMFDVLSNKSVRNNFKDEMKDLRKRAESVAAEAGRSSRIARKYNGSSANDAVLSVDPTAIESESDNEEGEADMQDEDEE